MSKVHLYRSAMTGWARVARYAGLLRGINVGGKNAVPMPALRALVEALGYTDVTTYIQSGNVVFSGTGVKAEQLEKAIRKEFELDIRVVLRTHRQLESVIEHNPFPRADTSTLHVGYMCEKPSAAAIKSLDVERFAPDELAFRGREFYLLLPNGLGRAKLPPYVDRRLKIPTTVRNWKTVTKLAELTAV
jgi:uncharacterized protein (DUF1697 family)